MTMDSDTWIASLAALKHPAAEVVVPATVDMAFLRRLVDHDLVPVFVDVRPRRYALEAMRAAPALCERTVGVYAPWTHGAAPDTHIRPACAVHEVSYYAPSGPTVPSHETTFWALYDTISPVCNILTLPEQNEHTPDRWTEFPLLAPDQATRDRLVTRLEAHGARPMAGCVVDHDDMATLGPWITVGTLNGAREIGARGFTVPLIPTLGQAVLEALRA